MFITFENSATPEGNFTRTKFSLHTNGIFFDFITNAVTIEDMTECLGKLRDRKKFSLVFSNSRMDYDGKNVVFATVDAGNTSLASIQAGVFVRSLYGALRKYDEEHGVSAQAAE